MTFLLKCLSRSISVLYVFTSDSTFSWFSSKPWSHQNITWARQKWNHWGNFWQAYIVTVTGGYACKLTVWCDQAVCIISSLQTYGFLASSDHIKTLYEQDRNGKLLAGIYFYSDRRGYACILCKSTVWYDQAVRISSLQTCGFLASSDHIYKSLGKRLLLVLEIYPHMKICYLCWGFIATIICAPNQRLLLFHPWLSLIGIRIILPEKYNRRMIKHGRLKVLTILRSHLSVLESMQIICAWFLSRLDTEFRLKAPQIILRPNVDTYKSVLIREVSWLFRGEIVLFARNKVWWSM